jgi:Holliday junction resolvase RusA-like endonuclease
VEMITVKVSPMGAVRMTKRGKWVSESAQRYLAYKQQIGYQLRKAVGYPTNKAVGVKVTFFMPIPDSWSKKDRADKLGKHHTVKPDIDNLLKGLFDASNKIVWKDDNLVVMCQASKIYSDNPRIELEVEEISCSQEKAEQK